MKLKFRDQAKLAARGDRASATLMTSQSTHFNSEKVKEIKLDHR